MEWRQASYSLRYAVSLPVCSSAGVTSDDCMLRSEMVRPWHCPDHHACVSWCCVDLAGKPPASPDGLISGAEPASMVSPPRPLQPPAPAPAAPSRCHFIAMLCAQGSRLLGGSVQSGIVNPGYALPGAGSPGAGDGVLVEVRLHEYQMQCVVASIVLCSSEATRQGCAMPAHLPLALRVRVLLRTCWSAHNLVQSAQHFLGGRWNRAGAWCL